MALAKVFSCAVVGLDGELVDVEVDVASGQVGFFIVGLPDAAVQEAKERVRSAIKNSGFQFPLRRAAFLGELALNGNVRHAHGVLPMVALAKDRGIETAYVPEADVREAALIE